MKNKAILTKDIIEEMNADKAKGKSIAYIQSKFKVCEKTVCRHTRDKSFKVDKKEKIKSESQLFEHDKNYY